MAGCIAAVMTSPSSYNCVRRTHCGVSYTQF
jgi:hypothetical protein